jgi:hypothetical protein
MPWLAVRSPMGQPNGLGPPMMLNYAAPPDPAAPTLGQGVAQTGANAWQWLQDQRAESVRQGLLDPETGLPTQKGLVDAAGQYAQGVMMGTITPGMRFKPGPFEVGDVTAHINPSRADMARMMQAAPNYHLRAFKEGPNLAIWPAFDATHGQMAEPLGFTKNAALRDYFGREGPPDDDFSETVGRFSVMGVER